jgi:drug/metabolite transporter (DMT)-like permease
MGPNGKGALLALLAFALYATHDVVVKFLGAGYSPFQLIFFSVLFSFPLAVLMLIRDPNPGTLVPVHPWWIALRTGAGIITGITAFYAFSTLPLTQVYAIVFATPLIITVLAIPILGERVRIRRWLAVVVGLCGVLVVIRPGSAPLSLGHLSAMVAAVGGAFASIVVRKIGQEERSVVIMLYPMLANLAVMACILPFVYKPMPIEHLGLLALMSLIGWTGGVIIIQAYKSAEAVIVAPMQYSQIILATAYGFFLFDEGLDLWTGVGAAIIIASGLYIVLREGRSGSSTHRPVLTVRTRPDTGTTPKQTLLARMARIGRMAESP